MSIFDVAREAGVALSTVSNALSGKDNVRESTRLRVQAAADRLGYRVSVVARSLRMQRTFTLGVLLADVANPSSPDFLRGIEDIADQEQCSLLVCNTDGQLDKQLAQMRVLLDRQVDGLVMLSQHCQQEEVRELLAGDTPYVLLQRRSTEHEDTYVGANNEEGIDAAVRHLVAFGHQRIGLIRGPADSSTADERYQAYLHALQRYQLAPAPDYVVQGDYHVRGGYQAAKRFFAMSPRPSAILAANDMSAIGVMNAAHEAGLKIPDDFSLIGLDDIEMASFSPINLTTIALQRREMGAAATTMLMKMIRQKSKPSPKKKIFPMKLIVRGSTGPVKTP
ncbi:LacI family DNA-binding transcriptional regulator [Pantoea sp. BAV 3049]|uniref:LacI family DNA-binding transcriptional regulator n=1 Tax=Pantoea sp. BAV 3049 TaxID=2654188 RepID=UPI00131DA4F2|nr:LacI family DNA-binding transcriptional regulator [Pantoea sp. BAV 3049]